MPAVTATHHQPRSSTLTAEYEIAVTVDVPEEDSAQSTLTLFVLRGDEESAMESPRTAAR